MSSPSDAWYLFHLLYHVACKGTSPSSHTRTSTNKVLVSIPEMHGFYLTFYPSIYIDVLISLNALCMAKNGTVVNQLYKGTNEVLYAEICVLFRPIISTCYILCFFGQKNSVKCELNVDLKNSIIETIVYLLI